MNFLKIDTSNNKKIYVEIKLSGKKSERITSDSKLLKSEAVLPLVDKLLRKHNLSPDALGEILVFEGPGSFTGLRVGISIANALGYLLKIPVNGRKIGDLAAPVYN